MHLYSVRDYLAMLADSPRWAAYRSALIQIVKPGMVVVELGSGLSVLSIEAVRLGAARVHCIEPNGVIERARELVTALELQDKIVFHQALSQDVKLPSRADLIVGDTRGITPLYESHLAIMRDARERLLRPGGTLIPGRDTMWAAPICSEELWKASVGLMDRLPSGLGLERFRPYVACKHVRISERDSVQLLARSASWAEIDYSEVSSTNMGGECRFRIESDCQCHGLAIWFSTELVPGIGYDNPPGRDDSIYGQLFFPFERPLGMRADDELQLEVGGNLVGGSYFWRWKTALTRSGRQVIATSQQTVLEALPPLKQLELGADHAVPELTKQGSQMLAALQAIDGRTNIREIALKVAGGVAPDEQLLELVREASRAFAQPTKESCLK